MKKLFISSLLASILSGCGGSDSEPNTAPTLTGNLEHEVLALESNTFTFTLNDKESDKISVTMSDNHNWVVKSNGPETLTITVNPDLFSVGEHVITMTLFDGKASADYDLKIMVKDNPQKWEEIDVSYESLVGGWESQDKKSIFAFSSEHQGVAIHDNQFTYLSYGSEGSENSGLQQIKCYVKKYECKLGELDYAPFPFRVIAQSGSQIRVVYEGGAEQQVVKTLIKQDMPQISQSMEYHVPYHGDRNSSSFLVGHIDFENQKADFSLDILKARFYGSPQLNSIRVGAEIVNNQIGNIVEKSIEKYNDYYRDDVTYRPQHYAYEHQYNSLDILYGSEQFTIFDLNYQRVLVPDADRSEELSAKIKSSFTPKNSISVITHANRVKDFSVEYGKPYFSQFYLNNQVEEESFARYRGTYFTVSDEHSGKLMIGSTEREATEQDVLLDIANGNIAIDYEGIISNIGVFKVANGTEHFLTTVVTNQGHVTPYQFANLLTEFEEGFGKSDFLSTSFEYEDGSIYKFSETELRVYETESSYSTQMVAYQDDGSVITAYCSGELVDNACPDEGFRVLNQYRIVNETLTHVVMQKRVFFGDKNINLIYKMKKL
ncbi:hypothetical protein L1077_04535 [Pseudoalteromonas luteoviolacea]|uniref:hypothetical protein n=1 Tax=Pseudoalteromonas luteoviolacea TaxID=43657 RepID=UPI001F3B6FC5|nr:hypothetical protein [Pseudoalteromonas luteoviolacea]MCF6438695.1 hypothetical protein [Pseudoalteromonas luteoviolacea]